jgi:uncharacterized damage-inducible protein DinB
VDADYFRFLFGYMYWVRDRILDQVVQLSQEEYVAPRSLDYGSIRATLVHAMGAEVRYLSLWDGKPPETPVNEETVPTAEALRARWAEQEQKMQVFLAGLTDEDCGRDIRQVSGRTGQETVTPLWVMMAQALSHNTQHRSEVALHITQLGHSPGDLDVSRYYRLQP